VNYTTATSCTVIFVAVADQGRPIPVFATGHADDHEPTNPPIDKIALRADIEANSVDDHGRTGSPTPKPQGG
jgi:acyl-CoA hydrolase